MFGRGGSEETPPAPPPPLRGRRGEERARIKIPLRPSTYPQRRVYDERSIIGDAAKRLAGGKADGQRHRRIVRQTKAAATESGGLIRHAVRPRRLQQRGVRP